MKPFDFGLSMHGAGRTRGGLSTETKTSQSEGQRQRRGIAAAVVMFVINAVLAVGLATTLLLYVMIYIPWTLEYAPSSEGGDHSESSRAQSRIKTMEMIGGVMMKIPLASAQQVSGTLAEQLGDFDAAWRAYARAVELSPTPASHYRFARMAYRMGRWDAALNSYRMSFTGQEAEYVWAKEGYFRTLLESGDRNAAEDAIQEFGWGGESIDYCKENALNVSFETQALVASVIRPGQSSCLLDVGRSLTDSGLVNLARFVLLAVVAHSSDPEQKEEAKAFLKRRLPPQNVSKLAESYNATGYNLQFSYRHPERAIKTYKKAIDVDPRFPWPYSNIGNTLKLNGKMEESISWFREALRRNPNYFRAHRNLGWALYRLNRHEEARLAYQRAIQLGPDDPFSHATMGRILLEMGDKSMGLRELRLAIKLDPSRTDDKASLNYWLGVDARRGPTAGLAL